MNTNEAQFEETIRIILDTARDSITSDFRISECKLTYITPTSFMVFKIVHEREHFGVSVVVSHDHQVTTVDIGFEIPKGTTFNENTWSFDANENSFRLDFKEYGIAALEPASSAERGGGGGGGGASETIQNFQGILDPQFPVQGILDPQFLKDCGHDKDCDYGFTRETIQNFQGIISREILSVHFKKIRVLCLRHSEEEVNTFYIANRERILAFVLGSHIRIGRYSRIRNIDSEIIRVIADKYMETVLPNASAAAVSGGGVTLA